MKSTIKKLGRGLNLLALRAAVWSQCVAPSADDLRAAARAGGVGAALLGGTAALANGLITGIQNATTATKALIGFISILGVLVGLGFMFSAAAAMYKKNDNSRDDITWGQIVGKAVAGAVSLALTYFATQFVITLGGSASDIGKGLGS